MTSSSIWHWVRDHRREKILITPFPSEWTLYMERNVAHYKRLGESDRKNLQDLVQIFIAEKHWEGCGGLLLTDEIQVTIATEACLMILFIPHDLYRGVESIFIYPSTVMTPEHRLSVFETSGNVSSGPIAILGEARLRGPLVLVWDSVLQSARHPETGSNVVYHEFAHKIDMLSGQANGTPILDNPGEYHRWTEICSKEFLRLRALTENGKHTFLDPYGATNEAEFFAVVTEKFFDQPVEMKKHCSELYELLCDFYRQDPAAC